LKLLPLAKSTTQKEGTAPPTFPDTIPAEAAGQHSFLLAAMFELRGSFGKVEKAVESLEKTVGDQAKSLDAIKKTLWVAAGVLTVATFLIVLIVEHNYDRIVGLLRSPHAELIAPKTPGVPAKPSDSSSATV
jgi:hypothetical protein